MTMPEVTNNCAAALAAVRSDRIADAENILTDLIEGNFGLQVSSLKVNRDQFSLNSVNGFVTVGDGRSFFFKFHHEEGEEHTLEELYRGEVLNQVGYPVDVPAYAEQRVGRQILLYNMRHDRRFFDICLEHDFDQDVQELSPILDAQRALDRQSLEIYLRTLHPADDQKVRAEAIHQLFFYRLADPGDSGRPSSLGGRARRFFYGREFRFPGLTLSANELRAAHWVINGVPYKDSIEALFQRSLRRLSPESLSRFGAVTAHGDAHNANVWWLAEPPPPHLVFFDPAFAGAEIPALMAEIKATFHNIFAHPLWLYHPDRAAENFSARVRYEDGTIYVDTDWQLSPLRQAFLGIKEKALWMPLLHAMRQKDILPSDWLETMRCALFCCPTLVMDLCAGGASGHNEISSIIGLSAAIMVGSAPKSSIVPVDAPAAFLGRLEAAFSN